MMHNVAFEKAAEAAKKAALTLEADGYCGFSDIGLGGVLSLGGESASSVLRLENDNLLSSGQNKLMDASAVRRDFEPCDMSCLVRDGDGGIRIKQEKNIGSVDL